MRRTHYIFHALINEMIPLGEFRNLNGLLAQRLIVFATFYRYKCLCHRSQTIARLLYQKSHFSQWTVPDARPWSCKVSVSSTRNTQPCLDPPKAKWHDGRRRINKAGKCIRENTALRTKFRGGVRIQACHAAVWIQFAFGRLAVMTTQASWLAQMGGGVLIGQRVCWLMTHAR